jgi:N-methylhydantoinase A
MRVGVDIGGTFTDVVVFDEATSEVSLSKALSTPGELARGVQDALGKSNARLDEVTSLIHGSTVVVNAIIERKGARTAIVTTKGFRDVYEIGRINRPESFNLHFKKHKPLVPRELIFEVRERMLADGSVQTPLDEAAAREVARILKDEGVEAVGIVFLHAYRAPEHETRMREILLEADPSLFVVASHELSREYREYERTSTTAANAFVGPTVSSYLGQLETRLRDDAFAGDLMIMQSNGGLYDLETARRLCIQMMESGPAGGVVGTMSLCEALGLESVIAFDMGGTTAKACVVQRGQPTFSSDYFLGGYNEGLAIRIPVLDIVEVGTGGGSIAWVDEGGALHVGPQSAGAEPGPVCYGRGGWEPTITDANVVLGRMSPADFLGGEMTLDRLAATEALKVRVAQPLGLGLERAAAGILEIATASMANAVRHVTLERGLDPRDFTLVAYGGAGPLHAANVARELSIGTVIVPEAPGHFSAFGMLQADLRRDYVQTAFMRLADVPMEDVEALFRQLQAEGEAALAESGVQPVGVVFERSADMRYVGQEHAVGVAMPGWPLDEASRAAIKQIFDAAHEQRFSHSAADEPAEIVSLRVSVVGRLEKPVLPELAQGGVEPETGARRGTRDVSFEAAGTVACAVYDRERLLAGNQIEGPAVIEEAASVTVLSPTDRATVNEFGHLVITVGAVV